MNQLGFHGFGVDFFDIHAAGSDDCLFDGPKTLNVYGKPLEQRGKVPALFAGDGIALCFGRNSRPFHQNGNHFTGQQRPQRIDKILIAVLFQIALESCVQLLGR